MRISKGRYRRLTNKVITLLGFAKKSGAIAVGEQSCLKAIKSNKTELVFLASDAGPNTQKRITDKCKYYNVQLNTSYDKKTLGQAIGYTERIVIGILDPNFLRGFKKILER